MKTKKIAMTAVLAAIICVLAPLSLPAGEIPLSLATFAIYIIAATVDWKYSFSAVIIYILLGAAGLPVFSAFTGGLQKLVGVTGGYIIGYIPCVLIIGLMISKLENKKWIYPLSMVLGTAVLYALGTAWFIFQTKSQLGAALAACVVPFLPGDAIKIAAACAVGITLRKRIKKFI